MAWRAPAGGPLAPPRRTRACQAKKRVWRGRNALRSSCGVVVVVAGGRAPTPTAAANNKHRGHKDLSAGESMAPGRSARRGSGHRGCGAGS
eukprot:9705982-Alexandrium_andersonii.AAC.1